MKGKKTGGGSRKGKLNKTRDEVRVLIDTVGESFTEGNLSGMELMIMRLFELANGVKAKDIGGEEPIYEVSPNVKAILGLIEHRFGKAPQNLDIGAIDGIDINIREIR